MLHGALGVAGLALWPRHAHAHQRQALPWPTWRVDRSPLDHARPYLDAALRAERWLATSAMRSSDGVTWPVWPEAPLPALATSLYSGTAGIVLAYLELHAATGDAAYLATARDGARRLAAWLPQGLAARDVEWGLYTGMAGVAWVIDQVATRTDDRALRESATRTITALARHAQPRASGVAWNDVTDIIAGSAGIALTMLDLGLHRRDEALVATARRAAAHLVTRGTAMGDGLRWSMTDAFPRRMPNFSHGTAGVAYALATIGAVTEDRALVDAARAGARHLDAIATPIGSDGSRIFHSEPGNESLFYLSWCHGPAGTARLYHRLHLIDGGAAHRATADRLARGVVASGVPERSPGFWMNVSQCCGNGGVVEHFVDRARVYGEGASLAYAERVM
ncbi:MAG: hypothetical protein MUE41_16810, partial [Gemmatimonadaceae bacterium]|nr:hypothetical protein [Gemmatimonadaceae bacterium]